MAHAKERSEICGGLGGETTDVSETTLSEFDKGRKPNSASVITYLESMGWDSGLIYMGGVIKGTDFSQQKDIGPPELGKAGYLA